MKNKHKIILILFLASAIFTLFNKWQNQDSYEGLLRVHYMDVGQGDCTLIQTSQDKTILIDSGNEWQADKVTSYIRDLGIDKLDLVIATHPDADHIGAMDKVIDAFSIDTFCMPDVKADTKQYAEILKALKKKKMKPQTLYRGDKVDIEPDMDFEILSPVEGKRYGDRNEYSIVARLQYKKVSFLFMADASIENELDIINHFTNIKADVLKLGHHGSSTSSSAYFLEKTAPKFAIISCGLDNTYGHPHEEVLRLLKRYKIGVYRTDEQQDILLVTDGEKIRSAKEPIYL